MNNLPREGMNELGAAWPEERKAGALDGQANTGPPVIAADAGDLRPSAVIDIGATSIRMTVAEIRRGGEVRTLDTLVQAPRMA